MIWLTLLKDHWDLEVKNKYQGVGKKDISYEDAPVVQLTNDLSSIAVLA